MSNDSSATERPSHGPASTAGAGSLSDAALKSIHDRRCGYQTAKTLGADVDALLGHIRVTTRYLQEVRGALQMMWDTACKSPTSTPSKAAFLKAMRALSQGTEEM